MARRGETFEITKKIISQVERLAAQGLSQEQIGSIIGCSPDTITRRKKDNAEFAAAIKKGQAKGIENITNALYEKAMEGDNTAIIFYLKNRDRVNWADQQQVEITTKKSLDDFYDD